MRRWSRARCFTNASVLAYGWGCFAYGEDTLVTADKYDESDGKAALLRAFDVLCVATRFDEAAFHKSVGLFGNADEIPGDVLRMLSPDNAAGYYLADGQGRQLAAIIEATRSGDVESRNCGVTASVGFEDAKALVSNGFPVDLVDQFDQGTNRFAVFRGRLVGYASTVVIGVQGGHEIVTVSVSEAPDDSIHAEEVGFVPMVSTVSWLWFVLIASGIWLIGPLLGAMRDPRTVPLFRAKPSAMLISLLMHIVVALAWGLVVGTLVWFLCWLVF